LPITEPHESIIDVQRQHWSPLAVMVAQESRLTPLADAMRRLHGAAFRMRVGINTGRVVVGAIGRDLRMDYRKNPSWHLQF